jgi:fatty-acyl-CoA synthase
LIIRAKAPHAFVLQGAHADERELREFARANLAHFKAPHSVTSVNDLPKTATGKVQKYVLRARQPAIAPQ